MDLKPHKHKDVIIAYANGHKIEFSAPMFREVSYNWQLYTGKHCPAFNEEFEYRVCDEFRELKEAYASGKKIQHKTLDTRFPDHWRIIPSPKFDGDIQFYRILPDEIEEARVAFESGSAVVMMFDGKEVTFDKTWGAEFTPYYGEVPDGATFKILPPALKNHKHAEAMMEYAKDAMETDKPWERWEFQTPGYGSKSWTHLCIHPIWSEDKIYRKKETK
jgi:hypothetical protein